MATGTQMPGTPPSKVPLNKRIVSQFNKAAESLQHRDFRYLAIGSLALGFGQWFQQIGLGWMVLLATGSPVAMVTVTAVRGVISVAVSPIGGLLSDRFSRTTVVAWSTGVACVQAFFLAAVALTGNLEIWHIFLFSVLEGAANGVYMPARQALLFNVVPRESIPNAVALNSISMNLARVTGPVAAGIAIGFWGPGSAFLVLAILKIIAGFLTLLIRPVAAQKRATKESMFAAMTAGFRYAIKDPPVASLLVIGLIPPVIILPYVQMLPFFAEKVLHGGPQTYGILATGVGWGSLVGLVSLAFIGKVQRKGVVTFFALFSYALFAMLFSRSTWLPLSMLFLMGGGISLSIHSTMQQSLLQLLTPDEVRGRVFSLSTMGQGLQPIGSFPMAIAVEAWGPANGVSAFMVLAMLATIAMAVLSPSLRATRA